MCKGDAEDLADKTREVLSSLEDVTRDLENISPQILESMIQFQG